MIGTSFTRMMTPLAQPRPDDLLIKIWSAFKSHELTPGAQNVMVPSIIRTSPFGAPMANFDFPRRRLSGVTKEEFFRSNALVRKFTEAESPINNVLGRRILTLPAASPSPVELRKEIRSASSWKSPLVKDASPVKITRSEPS